MKHLQDLLSDERRRLSNVRDALDKEMRLTKQLKEKLSVEKLLKSEVEHELAEVTKAKESLQRELKKDKSLMCETTNKLRDHEDSAGLKDEVYEEVKSELTTLKENCMQREGKQFTVPENGERLERLDGEINPFISKVPAKKVHIVEATTLGAVAVGMETNSSKSDYVKGPLKYLVAKLHGCYPRAISLPVSQNIFARFFSAPARRRFKSQVTGFLFRRNNARKTFRLHFN